MTKKELAQKMKEFIESQDSIEKEEWWATNQVIYGGIIEEFAKFLGVKLEEPK
jgi:ribosome-binding protein aMBF1 (putative translation factor)